MSTPKKWIIVLIASILLLALGVGPQPVAATPPAQATSGGPLIPYTGQLKSSLGEAVPEAAYDFNFALYDDPDAGNLL